jgi:hypothetical protein
VFRTGSRRCVRCRNEFVGREIRMSRAGRVLTVLLVAGLIGSTLGGPAAGQALIRDVMCDVIDCPAPVKCDAKATTPNVSGSTVAGTGSASCDGQTRAIAIQVVLQIHQVGPFWQNISNLNDGKDFAIGANSIGPLTVRGCVGGQRTYRTVTDVEWQNPDGTFDDDQDVSDHFTRTMSC